MWSLLKEFFRFCRQEKKWWLAPLIVVLVLLGVLIIFASAPAVSAFIYSGLGL